MTWPQHTLPEGSTACIQIIFCLPTTSLITGAVYLILGIWVALLTVVILICGLLAFLMSLNASAGKSLQETLKVVMQAIHI